jgi:hypothetical protein
VLLALCLLFFASFIIRLPSLFTSASLTPTLLAHFGDIDEQDSDDDEEEVGRDRINLSPTLSALRRGQVDSSRPEGWACERKGGTSGKADKAFAFLEALELCIARLQNFFASACV